MAIPSQTLNINFGQGLDTKTDPYQVAPGKFLSLTNSVFTTTGRLTKRSGFANITTLPTTVQTNITTYNNNLVTTGSSLYAYNKDISQWIDKGVIQPVTLSVSSIVRSSTEQLAPDSAVAANGLLCTTYVDTSLAYYQISDVTTGQQIMPRQSLPSTATSPRVFLLGQYFVITFMATVSGTTHLQYVAIPIVNPSVAGTPIDIGTNIANLTAGYDGVVANNSLFLSWQNNTAGISTALLNSSLQVSNVVSEVGQTGNIVSLCADTSGTKPIIYVSFTNSGAQNGYIMSYSANLAPILTPTSIITGKTVLTLGSTFANGVANVFFEVSNTYGAGPNAGVNTNYVQAVTVTPTGTVSAPTIIIRSVGLASKPFVDASTGFIYMLVAFGEGAQQTYFLIDSVGQVYMRLAYSNGGGYTVGQVLPHVVMYGNDYVVPYRIKDLLASVNKGTDLPSGTPTAGVYTQTGINIARFSINAQDQYSTEIASALHLTGGQLWEYDGVKPVEHGFQVWPENVGTTQATTGGSIGAGTYYYQFCYEWTDNQGNLHRSAPSIPALVTTTGSTNAITLYVPTLRLTYKVDPNPVRIVGYRWSTTQQNYYQFTSITSPVINDTTVDQILIVDTQSDAQILGQTLLYTTGGILEDIAAPASVASCLFGNRLWLVTAEDRNLLWYSKQIIESTPVEMSDLLTYYVAPTTGAQGSTGDVTALAAMDDKLIIFKKDAMYYIAGTGPDNAGANSQYSPDPVFISSAVGCSNPDSIVLTPNGLMFQSDKGIWLLGRDLSTTYIGQDVEKYNNQTVRSAQTIPGTNQVRFIVDNQITLVFDYFFQQWSTFTNIRAISATLYNGFQTYLNAQGNIFQETPGTYIDGSSPVLMSFTSSWFNLAGLQGYERFREGFLLGTYKTPFKLSMQLAYDYNSSSVQQINITPDNFSPNWGGDASWGSNQAWGGPGNVFSARFFPQLQKCQAFQVTISEIYDPSLGVAAGEGLSLSGMALDVAMKKGSRTQSAKRSFG